MSDPPWRATSCAHQAWVHGDRAARATRVARAARAARAANAARAAWAARAASAARSAAWSEITVEVCAIAQIHTLLAIV